MTVPDAPARPVAAPWRRLAAFCLDVVFPPACARCGRAGYLICPACEALMARTPAAICPRCGRFQEEAATQPPLPLCRECRTAPSPLAHMRAALRYEAPTSDIIHRFKYEGYFALAAPLARLMIAAWPEWEHSPDLVLPIPLHPRRRRRRGYNQSELLARPLGQARNIPVDVAALRRIRHTAPQIGLGPDERRDNVQGAFEAEATRVAGRRVLLIDDVLTTGATMTAAAEALLEAGAAEVAAYCLARVG